MRFVATVAFPVKVRHEQRHSCPCEAASPRAAEFAGEAELLLGLWASLLTREAPEGSSTSTSSPSCQLAAMLENEGAGAASP
jgi:hypothetical protein